MKIPLICTSGVRILDSYTGATASEEALALTHALSHVDVYSNSWGPSDDGTSFSDITSVQLAAFQKGVTQVCKIMFFTIELHLYSDYSMLNTDKLRYADNHCT